MNRWAGLEELNPETRDIKNYSFFLI